jgi:hypothetical protein
MCLRRSLVVIGGSSIAALSRRALFVSGGALSLLLSGLAAAQSPGIRAPSLEGPPESRVTVGQMLAQIPDAPGDEGVGPPDEEPPMTDIWPAPAVVPKKKGATAAEIVHLMHKAMARTPTPASLAGASRAPTHGHSQRTPTPSVVAPSAGE